MEMFIARISFRPEHPIVFKHTNSKADEGEVKKNKKKQHQRANEPYDFHVEIRSHFHVLKKKHFCVQTCAKQCVAARELWEASDS